MKHSFPKRLTAFALAIFTVLSVLVAVPIFTVGVVAAEGDSYELVTDASTLALGDEIIITATNSAVALSTEQKTNNRGQTAITKNGTTIVPGADVQILTLEAGLLDNTFAFFTGSGYLYAAGGTGKNNYLKTQDEKSEAGSWTIEITSAGVATIKAPSTVARNWLRHNSSSSLFSCYASGQADVSIYKLIPSCTHENTTDIGNSKDATCGDDGITAGIKCADCGKVVEEQATIPATGNHTFAHGACTVCGAADPDACAHANTTVLDAVAPTCTETGLTEGLQCADCEEIVTAQTTVDALGHTVEIDAAVDATCTETGLTEGKHCSVCNEVLVKQDVIPAGHNVVDGVCTVCGLAYAQYKKIDLADITAGKKVIIVSTKDNASYAMSNGNGTSKAPTAVAVTVNGDMIAIEDASSIIWNIANDNGNITIYSAGTTDTWLYCTNANNGVRVGNNENKIFTIEAATGYLVHSGTGRYLGVYNNADWRCYTSINSNIEGQTFAFYVECCAHTSVTEYEAKDATCIEDGYSAYSVCNACGEVIGKTVIPNLGGHIDADPVDGKCDNCGINLCTEHKWIDGDVIDEGSCTTDKIIAQVCENCGEAGENRTIPYEGHKYEGHVCTKCGDIEIIPAGNMTISEFNSIASAQPNKGATTTNKYTVTGMITEIKNTEYGNIYIQDEDGNKLYIYGIYNADGSTRFDEMNPQPQVGDTITVVGVAANFNGPQMVNGWVTELVPLTTPKIMSFSLSLNKGITVNVSYYIPSEWLAENAGAKLVFSNGKELAATAGLATYSVDLTPGQIDDALTLTLKVGETEVATHDVSVAQYQTMFVSAGPAGMGLSETRYAALENLLKSINTLAAAADNDLTDELTEDFSEVTKDPVIYDPGELFGSISAVVGEKASIQLNVNVDKIQDVYAIAVTLGNKTLVDGRPPLTDYVTANAQIVLNGLYPTHFDEEINVSVYSSNDNDDKAAILQFTFNSYLKALYDTCEAGSNAQKLVAAIYQYGLAVEAYRSV